MVEDNLGFVKQKITSIFRYLQGFDQLSNPPQQNIPDQTWKLLLNDIPKHPSIQVASIGVNGIGENGIDPPLSQTERENIFGNILLIVSRPEASPPPIPPVQISSWLQHGWDKPDGVLEIHKTLTETKTNGEISQVFFEDDLNRIKCFERWKKQWQQWRNDELPTYQALNLFYRLHKLHSELKREAEKIELILGDGIIYLKDKIKYPLLTQRLQLHFDPTIPRIILSISGLFIELNVALLRVIPGINGEQLGQFRKELEEHGYDILEAIKISNFLKRLVHTISAKGEFYETKPKQSSKTNPVIFREPIIYIRSRTLGFSRAIETILEDIPKRQIFPEALLKIVGVDNSNINQSAIPEVSSLNGISDKVLFTKTANREQYHIAQTLETHSCVLVQGPPGTGKTHTIGNLLGNLLAQGKSVLVTSYTSKALRVLKEQVNLKLQPLCVSFLGSDVESRKELEQSVTTISERLTVSNINELHAEANLLQRERNSLLIRLADLRDLLRESLTGEYKTICVYNKTPYSPCDAARLVTAGIGKDDWIPGPVNTTSTLPISREDLRSLYRLNENISDNDESESLQLLPDPKEITSPDEFEKKVNKWHELEKNQKDYDATFWAAESITLTAEQFEHIKNTCLKGVLDLDYAPNWQLGIDQQITLTAEQFEHIKNTCLKAVQDLDNAPDWQFEAIEAGRKGGASKDLWDNFIKLIQNVNIKSTKTEDYLLKYAPQLSNIHPYETQKNVFKLIGQYVKKKKWNTLEVFLNHNFWYKIWKNVSVSGTRPYLYEHFEALFYIADLEIERQELLKLWEQLMVAHGADRIPLVEKYPERICEQVIKTLTNLLNWYSNVWIPITKVFSSIGFCLNKLLDKEPITIKRYPELIKIRKVIIEILPSIFKARINRILFNSIEEELFAIANKLSSQSSAKIVSQLHKAITEKDVTNYREIFNQLLDILDKKSRINTRDTLIKKLEEVAPNWAKAIRNREPPHHNSTLLVLGDVESAWLWRQLYDELNKGSSIDINQIQKEIINVSNELQRVTCELVAKKAWAAQIERTTQEQRMALVGWLHTIKKIGKGSGKRTPKLQVHAREAMVKCRSSVPVWIMPIAQVLDNFSLTGPPFDVIIIDEASQSDIMALINLYIARQTIIVGDQEQVTPAAIGQDLGQVQILIDENLSDIPNNQLFDGRTSIYDLAMQCFKGYIRLLEHFRCVPEIIQFSNLLSYEGKIKPLRDTSKVLTKPPVISVKTNGFHSTDNVNEYEAITITSLICAALEYPEYDSKSMGIISLVGEEQSKRIETLLREKLPLEEIEKRRIICGNAAQFQGDERDIMFLSVIDGPKERIRSLRNTDLFRKRYNVAASRARDQMWVVYSLDPKKDLQENDLRRQLIEYAINAEQIIPTVDDSRVLTELEKNVYDCLVDRGFKVTTRCKVGYYSIDLVVEDNGKKLAIECDGDCIMGDERLQLELECQETLERLGWDFIRIRGSEFYRDKEKSMCVLFNKLNELSIDKADNSGDQTNSCIDLRKKIFDRAKEIRKLWGYPNVIVTNSYSYCEHVNVDKPQRGIVDATMIPNKNIIIECITEEDIRKVLLKCLPTVGDIEHTHLLLSASAMLGYRDLEPEIESRLNKVLDAERHAGRLETIPGIQKHRRIVT